MEEIETAQITPGAQNFRSRHSHAQYLSAVGNAKDYDDASPDGESEDDRMHDDSAPMLRVPRKAAQILDVHGARGARPRAAHRADDPADLVSDRWMPRYERFPGKRWFACYGRLNCGPKPGLCFFAAGLIIVPSVAYGTIILPALSSGFFVLVGILFMLALTCSLCCLLITSSIDPGIVAPRPTDLRAPPPPASWHDLAPESPLNHKYCDTCNAWRPPRAKHSRTTDTCVKRFDHYCPWVSNDVGERNYPFFVCFLLATTAVAVLVGVTSGMRAFSLLEDVEPLTPRRGRGRGRGRFLRDLGVASDGFIDSADGRRAGWSDLVSASASHGSASAKQFEGYGLAGSVTSGVGVTATVLPPLSSHWVSGSESRSTVRAPRALVSKDSSSDPYD